MVEARQLGEDSENVLQGCCSDTTKAELVVRARWKGIEFLLIAT